MGCPTSSLCDTALACGARQCTPKPDAQHKPSHYSTFAGQVIDTTSIGARSRCLTRSLSPYGYTMNTNKMPSCTAGRAESIRKTSAGVLGMQQALDKCQMMSKQFEWEVPSPHFKPKQQACSSVWTESVIEIEACVLNFERPTLLHITKCVS